MAKSLDDLRAKYAGAKGGDIHDPALQKVAALVFDAEDSRTLPYADAPTLLDAPYKPQPGKKTLQSLDVGLVGVPMDLGVTNRPGARFGPRAVRTIERIGPFHHVHRIAPSADVTVADIGDVPFRSRFSLDQCLEDIEDAFKAVVAAGNGPAGRPAATIRSPTRS